MYLGEERADRREGGYLAASGHRWACSMLASNTEERRLGAWA